jgi:hypothetical protein
VHQSIQLVVLHTVLVDLLKFGEVLLVLYERETVELGVAQVELVQLIGVGCTEKATDN